MRKPLLVACSALLLLGASLQDAEANRLAGGLSKGVQREPVTQRQAATPQPTAPTQQIAPHPAAPTPTPVPATGKHGWLGPLAGLAAGIGLGALLAHWGLGEGIGNLLMLLLLAVAGGLVVKWLFRRQAAVDWVPDREHSLLYDGVGGPAMAPIPPLGAMDAELVENDVRPSGTNWPRNIPANFDQEEFVRTAKDDFLRLQLANDADNLDDLREFATPEMLAELKKIIADRQGAIQRTDIVGLETELLEVVEDTTRHLASIRFHGMIREKPDAPALPFDEVWHLSKPAEGSRRWLIAGIQHLK